MTPRKQQALAAAVAAAAATRRREAAQAYRGLVPLVRALRRQGLSYERIAARLNADGHTTRQGKPFHAAQARLILVRAVATRRRR